MLQWGRESEAWTRKGEWYQGEGKVRIGLGRVSCTKGKGKLGLD